MNNADTSLSDAAIQPGGRRARRQEEQRRREEEEQWRTVTQSTQTHVPADDRAHRDLLNSIKAGDSFRERQLRIWNSRSSRLLLATFPSHCAYEVLQDIIVLDAIQLYNGYSPFYQRGGVSPMKSADDGKQLGHALIYLSEYMDAKVDY